MPSDTTRRATHVVARPFEAGGRVLRRGTPVNAAGWRNARLLEAQRYLVPIASREPTGRAVAPGTGEGDE